MKNKTEVKYYLGLDYFLLPRECIHSFCEVTKHPTFVHEVCCPDVTFAVHWPLKINYLFTKSHEGSMHSQSHVESACTLELSPKSCEVNMKSVCTLDLSMKSY